MCGREEFERIFKSVFKGHKMTRGSNGDYVSVVPWAAWKVWQKGRAQQPNLSRIAQKKLDQMGATVHGVLVKNEAGSWAAVSDAGRVMWLDGFEGKSSAATPQPADNWIWPTKQNPEPKHDGNWLTYRPDAPVDSQVATIWYDSKHNGWSGKYSVAAWMKRPNPPAEGAE